MGLTSRQLTVLVLLRIAIGWHFLYEGLSKWLTPGWSSMGYLLDSKGMLENFFTGMASVPSLVRVVDLLNVYGLMAVGIGLITGFLCRPALLGGMMMLVLYYLSHPPLIETAYAIPSEGSYFLVNKNLIELLAMVVLYLFPTEREIGIDKFIFRKKDLTE